MSPMVRGLVALCIGLGGMGCAEETRQSPPPDPRPLPVRMEREEVRTALGRWMDCADRHIKQMDDGKRDSRILVALVTDRCRPAYDAYLDVMAEGLTSADRSELRRRFANRDSYYVSAMVAGRRRSS